MKSESARQKMVLLQLAGNCTTVRSFKNKYEQMIKSAKRKTEAPEKVIKKKKRGRPILPDEIDDMVQRFLLSLRKKDEVVNEIVAKSVAKTFVKRSGKPELISADLDGKWWIQSLYCHMGFVRRAATTSKVEIPEGTKKEAELVYLHSIVSTIEKYQIHKSMVLYLDQTSLKYALCSRHTLEKKNAKHVAIAETSYNKAITGTSVIILEGKCLPFQSIYGGKTSKRLPRF